MEIFVLAVTRNGHSERGGKRRRRVTRSERVVLRFVAAEKAGQTAILLYRMQFVAAAGQYLVCVSLMTDVPNETVVRRIKHIMHRHGKFDSAEASTCVAANTRAGV